MRDRDEKDLHEDNEKSRAEKKREDMPDAPDATQKRDGVTSSFSAVTQSAEAEQDMMVKKVEENSKVKSQNSKTDHGTE